MALKDLNLKEFYDSDEDDTLNDFYIPALSEAISYKRIAGFFTSSSLAISAKGLSKFIFNGGRMQLIACAILSKEDYEKIKEVTEKPFIESLEKEFIESLENIEDELVMDHVKMLGWMLKKEKLEIKISLVTKGTGIPHQKIGILEDSKGNILSFTGSDNETEKGWIDNIEDFHVFCNWKPENKKHLEGDINTFEKFWNDLGKRAKVFPISEAVKNNLIRIAPKNDEEFKKLSKETSEKLLKKNREVRSIKMTSIVKELPPLWAHQEEAVKKWTENGYSGIVEMATGTGKTNVAISCLKNMSKQHPDNFLVIIGCPTKVLVSQWKNDLKEYMADFDIISISKDESKDSIYRSIINSPQDNHIIIGAYASLSKSWFIGVKYFLLRMRYIGWVLKISQKHFPINIPTGLD